VAACLRVAHRLGRIPRRSCDQHEGGNEGGNAVIEFLAIYLALLIPIIYAIVIMADVQRAMLATSNAARETARVYATATTHNQAEQRATTSFNEMLANYQLPTARAVLQLSSVCPAGAPPACQAGFGPSAEVTVVVTYQVPILHVPLIGGVGPSLTVGAHNHTRIDRYRGLG